MIWQAKYCLTGKTIKIPPVIALLLIQLGMSVNYDE